MSKLEILEVNGINYQVKVHYENRKNSRASIGKKTVNIRIPLFLNTEEQFRELLKLKSWAKKKLDENLDKFNPEIQKKYENKDILKIRDEEYRLNIQFKDKKSISARVIDNTIYLSIPNNLSEGSQNKHISDLLSRCLASKRLPQLKEKINELNSKYFNKKIKNIFFKHNKSNWGSCSGYGNINISTRLLFAPEDVLEYVCIHELAHLIEQNHSKKFWGLVEKAMPNYKEKKQWLKVNGGNCRF